MVESITKALLPEVSKMVKKAMDDLPPRQFYGGYTDSNVRFALQRMVVTETPSGAINGSNTAYTVSRPIRAIFGFMLNGEAIPRADYTFTNRTITFTSALPAAYSGKDFEITFI